MDHYHDDGNGQTIELKSFDTRVAVIVLRQHLVSFTFKFETVVRSYLLQDSGRPPDFLREERVLQAPATVRMAGARTDPDKPDPEMRRMLESVLLGSHPHLSDANRRWVVEGAVEKALEILRAQEAFVCVNLEIGLLVEENRVIYGGGVRMVPAVDSSIESLKEYGKVGTEGCCSICFEEISGRDGEISGRGRLLCMPCDHVFHGDCIRSWLKISHYCPICRYEMPTN